MLEFNAGYAFDRYYGIGQNQIDNLHEKIDIAPGAFIAPGLRARFQAVDRKSRRILPLPIQIVDATFAFLTKMRRFRPFSVTIQVGTFGGHASTRAA